jgi:hypothetical protein
MPHARPAVLTLAALALAVGGCGGSAKSSPSQFGSIASNKSTGGKAANGQATSSGGPLTRSQLIAQGDTICYRLNAKRSSTRISRPQDYAREIPALAAYELTGAEEMAKLAPPATMARDWRQMFASAQQIAVITNRFGMTAATKNEKLIRKEDIEIGNAQTRLVSAAKHAGFKDCAKFD